MKKCLSAIGVLLFIFSCNNSSQSSDDDFLGYQDRVSFSEVHLDTIDHSKSWIELYNPTNMDIQIDGGRYSHIRCITCLPSFTVSSKSYIVLCANDSVFSTYFGEIDNLLEISTIGEIPNWGGYFGIYTKRDSVKLNDVFRFGFLGDMNTKDWLEGSEIVPFVSGDSSYSLSILGKSDLCNLYKFEKTTTTPGF